MTRREWIALSGAAVAAQAQTQEQAWIRQAVERHDAHVERLLRLQVTDPASRWRGTYADEYGLHYPGFATGLVDAFVAAYLHSGSRFHRNAELPRRVALAAGLLEREQSADGNIFLPITNFNSPPDTAFVLRGLCPAALLARRAGETAIATMLEPFLTKAGAGLVKGGIHTPNHRWVLCAALAQLHELYPNPDYVRRIDQWLAEGIDIDPDGQYTERSTYVYNPITNAAFVVLADKLKRPELLDPVRRNLESMLYMLHPGYELVTEISRRQDLNQVGDMGAYWFPLAYMAHRDKEGRYATLARHFAAQRASISALMEYPQLTEPGPAVAAVPDNYARVFPHNRFARVRRGAISATILAGGRSRFLTFRGGEAVINAVRFASAFFGKAQFVSEELRERGGVYQLMQPIEAPYYQPFDPPRKVNADEWEETRPGRTRTEICRLTQSAVISETPKGLRVHIRAQGTPDVPLAVEINFREGGRFEGVVPAHKVKDGWLMEGKTAVYRMGSDAIRFGPGLREHAYTQVRGAEPKLDGPSVYLTGYTPFDHTIEFEYVTG
ncbi:MAG: hypothetical protein ACK5AZ_08200 [Bryobacteraceae bacterium]